MSSAVVVRAQDANAPISAGEKAGVSLWTCEGWLPASAFDGAVTGPLGVDGAGTDEGSASANLCAFLDAQELDACAVWVVLSAGSLVAVQSIDLF